MPELLLCYSLRCSHFVFSARFGGSLYRFNFAFCSTTYVCPLSHLSLLGFVTFVIFTLRCHLFFILRSHRYSSYNRALSHNIFHSSFLMKPVAETWSIQLPLVLWFKSMRFVLDECQNFFSFAHFRAAIRVSSSRFGAAFYCFNFAFCSTSYVRPLYHLSLLGFVTFVISTLCCHLFSLLRSHRFSS